MNRRTFVKMAPAFPVAASAVALTVKHPDGRTEDIADVSVLRVKPGDYVVLRCQGHVSMEGAERLKHLWESKVPNTTAIVLGDGLELGVLRVEK